MFRATQAGTLYAIVIFLIGFILGTIRVLLLALSLGDTTAVIVEVPMMLAVGRLVCRWCMDRLDVGELYRLVVDGLSPVPGAEFGLGAALGRSLGGTSPQNNSATRSEESATDWIRSLLARFTKCPNEVIFDTGLSDGEVRVLLTLNALDWNEKGWSEHSEETMPGLIGKKVRQFRNILTSLREKDNVFQQRRGDRKTAKLYSKLRVERNAVVKGYKRD